MKIVIKIINFVIITCIASACSDQQNSPEEPVGVRQLSKSEEIHQRCVVESEQTTARAEEFIKRKRLYDAEYLLRSCDQNLHTPNALRSLHEKIQKQASDADKKRRKAHGVEIGMTASEVKASSWGPPEHINRTTTASGTREQWVYKGYNYLYFENDILTTIQH